MKKAVFDNFRASKCLKGLHLNYAETDNNARYIVKNAFKVYNSIEEDRNVYTINTMLKLLFKLKHTEKVGFIWKDIEHLHRDYQQYSFLAYPLLLKCCINSPSLMNGDKCIQILRWMIALDYKLNISAVYITKLITKILKTDKNIDTLKFVHSFVDRHYVGAYDIVIKTQFINAYGELDDFENALNVFESIDVSERNSFCISSMMKAHVKNDLYDDALDLYAGVDTAQLNDVCHLIALKACKLNNAFDKGLKIVDTVNEYSKECISIELQNLMIDFYGHIPSKMEEAESIFNAMKVRDSHTIGAMMGMYINQNMNEKCLDVYDEYNSFSDDDIIKILAIKACINSNNLEKGKEIHQSIGSNVDNIELSNILIAFYGHFKETDDALNIFNHIGNDNKSEINYGAMMKAYSDNGYNEKALDIYFKNVHSKHDICANHYDVCKMLALKACLNMNDFERGNSIIETINIEQTSHIQLQNTLIDFYGHPSNIDIKNAQIVFDSIDHDKKDIISLRAMLNAYYSAGLKSECMELFGSMQSIYSIEPNILCYKIVFNVCGSEGWLTTIKQLEDNLNFDLEKQWFLDETDMQTTLINVYAQCGALDVCQDIFENIKMRQNEKWKSEIEVWNAMIQAYANNGTLEPIYNLLDIMKSETNLEPTKHTFVLLINACSHCGDLYAAANIWQNEIGSDELRYEKYVCGSFIDCLARKGYVTKAYDIIMRYEKYTKSVHESMWTSLLTGCKLHSQKLLGLSFYEQYYQRFNTHKERLQFKEEK